MKITAFNGSPRTEKGNTHIMVEAFLEGAKSAGAECENIFLAKKKINHCIGCFACWLKTPGECVFKDDMKDLLTKYLESDVVLFATPLYVDNITGIMKDFMDRMVPLADPHFETDENGETRHPERFRGQQKKFVVISNCGFPEQSHFQVLKLLFRRIARNSHAELVAEIYRGEGELFQAKDPNLNTIFDSYKNLLRRAGKEVVEQSKLSENTIEELEKPLIPCDLYFGGANEFMDKSLGGKK